MARRKYWLGSQGPFFYDDEKTFVDGTPQGIRFEEVPTVNEKSLATDSDVIDNAGVQRINGIEAEEITISALSPLTVSKNTEADNIIVSCSGYDGTITIPSTHSSMVYDLAFFRGVLQTVVERVEEHNNA